MIALSIRQPWCHRILYEGKDIENRSWPTKFRGRFLIHAGKKPEDKELCKELDTPLGGFVGVASVVDCVSSSDSEWFMGDYGFVLENPVPIEFIPYRGQLGFFNADITPEQLKRIEK